MIKITEKFFEEFNQIFSPLPFFCNFFCSQALLFLKRESAQKVLTEFQKRPEAWTKVDAILQKSQFSNTKFFALGILEELIKFKWKILPENQRDGIKNFVVTLIIQIASDPNRLKAEKLFINKLNLTLVQVTYSPKKKSFNIPFF